jgi:tetratricopeptide (TPR) repeat protein
MGVLQTFLIWFLVPMVLGFILVFAKPVQQWVQWWHLEREGIVAIQEGRDTDAALRYQEALKTFPKDGHFKLQLAKVWHYQGRFKEAKLLYQQGMAEEAAPRLQDYLNYARLLASHKQWNDAITQYQLAIKHYGKTHLLLSDLGYYYDRLASEAAQKGYPDAEAGMAQWSTYYYQQALALNPTYPPALYGHGLGAMKSKQWGKAAGSLCSLVKAQPRHWLAWYQLGFSLMNLGMTPQGLGLSQGALKKMAEVDPQETYAKQIAQYNQHLQLLRQVQKRSGTPPPPPEEPKGLTEDCLHFPGDPVAEASTEQKDASSSSGKKSHSG